MEQLRTELSHLLGEKLSRVECVSEQAATALWFLYDAQGNPMPLLARSFTTPGVARQLAWKISTLARNGTVRMPVVYGVMTHEEHPGPDVLLLERLRGVPVEAPTRTPARWEQLQEQMQEQLQEQFLEQFLEHFQEQFQEQLLEQQETLDATQDLATDATQDLATNKFNHVKLLQ